MSPFLAYCYPGDHLIEARPVISPCRISADLQSAPIERAGHQPVERFSGASQMVRSSAVVAVGAVGGVLGARRLLSVLTRRGVLPRIDVKVAIDVDSVVSVSPQGEPLPWVLESAVRSHRSNPSPFIL